MICPIYCRFHVASSRPFATKTCDLKTLDFPWLTDLSWALEFMREGFLLCRLWIGIFESRYRCLIIRGKRLT